MQLGGPLFGIISYPRCGSHMIASALESRGDISAQCEPFNHHIEQTYSLATDAGQVLSKLRIDNNSKSEVGFILHRHHARNEQFGGSVWETLRSLEGFRVLLVHRKNHLRRIASFKIACITERWQKYRGETDKPQRVSVSRSEFVENVRTYFDFYSTAWNEFTERQVLPVCYEDIVENEQPEYSRIQRFLGFDVRKLTARTVKQDIRRIQDIISNYDELVEALKGSVWADLIESD